MPSRASAGALSGDGREDVVADAGGLAEPLGLCRRLGAGEGLIRRLGRGSGW